MGTISDKLMRIINTKEDIRQALISKGYDVPTSIPFKEYAKMILDLPCKVDSFPDIEGVAFEKIESSNKGYWNLGAGGIIDFAKSPFTWQTSKQYNNVGILKGDKNHGKPL